MEFFNELFSIEVRKTLHLIVLGAFLIGVFIGIGISIYLN
jgi:hypothetical protein